MWLRLLNIISMDMDHYHYKAEHYALLKECMTILELAVWGAKIAEAEAEKERDNDNKSLAVAAISSASVSPEENLSEKLSRSTTMML